MIIASAGKKGGCTKTTFATNFAVSVAQRGASVAVLDNDPSQNASLFFQNRADSGLEPAVYCEHKVGNVGARLQELNEQYDVVVVDCAGVDTGDQTMVLLQAHLAYLPLKASVYDLKSLWELDEKLRDIKVSNKNLKIYAILGEAETNRNSKNNRNARAAIAEQCAVAEQMEEYIYQNVLYRNQAAEGWAITESNSAAGKANFNKLTDAIMQHMTALYEQA